MEICDLINETEDGPKDAIKAIRKRLNQNASRNFQTTMYTLTVLETCVKNCQKKFHVLVCQKDFIQVFELIIRFKFFLYLVLFILKTIGTCETYRTKK